MNNKVTLETAKKRLDETNQKYIEFKTGDGFTFLCTQYGGRVLGPFENENSESIMWMNNAFNTSKEFQKFMDEADWNVGGDRIWVLPEMPLFVRKREDFHNTYVIQHSIDPGNYNLETDGNTVTMYQDVSLETFECDCKRKDFYLKRTVRNAENPLRNLKNFKELSDDVKYCGIEQELYIRDDSEDKSLYLEGWFLSQINPKGTLIVPMTANKKELIDYYEPMDSKMCEESENGVRLCVTGDVRYKIGFFASQITGRSGYMGSYTNGQKYLFIRNYNNNPSSVYCGDPFDRPGLYGCSLFFNNGFREQGGFSEFEHCCNTISGDTGKTESHDTCCYYFFVGEEEKLKKIAKELLGDI